MNQRILVLPERSAESSSVSPTPRFANAIARKKAQIPGLVRYALEERPLRIGKLFGDLQSP